jgi:nucleotide sugar dehydrogenase
MIRPSLIKILIVGLGQLGLPVTKYVKERGFDTYVYDTNSKAIEIAHTMTGIKQVTDFGSDDFDVFMICISTHKPNDMVSPQIVGILSVADKISKEAKKDGALVSIESTIPKGTSKKVYEIFNHRLHVVHAPHRWYALEERDHGVSQVRVIGGVHDCCLKAGMQFYNGGNSRLSTPYRSLGIPMHPVSTIEIAETTKVVENAHRYLQIALAEELYLYCQANNINFQELRDALNTKWNVEILEPREGIGGHCLPKDTRMFLESSKATKSKILTAAIEVDEDYRSYRQSRDKQTLLTSLQVNRHREIERLGNDIPS